MGHLWAVAGDPNSHGGGGLHADNPQTVFVNGIAVIDHGPDSADPDSLCFDIGPPHCSPDTAGGSGTVFVYNKPAHRQDDPRVCGATTVVTNQATVFLD
jgi:uncharacterized Zn-binding protein involved in type VI secretion